MERNRRNFLICLAVCLYPALGLADEPVSVNQISTVDIAEEADGTSITIVGSSSPTFSVYRLDNPARLFIDFSNTAIAGEVTNWSIRNGLVDDVMVLQYQDDQSLVTRVVVALQDDGAQYDITTEGFDVVALISGESRDHPHSGTVPDQQELEVRQTEIMTLRRAAQQAEQEAREAQAAALTAEAERQAAALRALRLEQERRALDVENEQLRQRTADAEARAAEVLAEYESALRALQGYQVEIANQRQHLQDLNEQTERWQQEVSRLTGELSGTRSELQQRDGAIREALAREEQLRSAIVESDDSDADREREMADLLEERELLREQLSSLQSEYGQLVDEVSDTNAALVEAENNLSQVNQERSDAEAQAAQSQVYMSQIQTELRRLEAAVVLDEQTAQVQNEQLVQLETEFQEVSRREQEQRASASRIASELEQARQELQEARDNEGQMQQDMQRLQQCSRDLERQLEELTAMAGQRDLLSDELEENQRNQRRLQRELEDNQAQLQAVNGQVAEAIDLRQQYEREAQQAEREHQRVEGQLAEIIGARQVAEQAAQQARQELALTQSLLEQRRTEQLRVDRELAQAMQERENLNAQLAQLASDQLRQEQDLLEARRDLAELQSEMASLAEERAETQQELEAARVEQHRATEQLEALQTRRETVSQQLSAAESHLNQVLEQRDQMTADIQALQQTLSELQTERTQAEASLDRLAWERDRMESEIQQLEQRLRQMEEERTALASSDQANQAARDEQHRAAEQLGALQARRETVSQELSAAESHLNQVLEQRDQMTADIQALQQTLSELQTERSQAEASLDRVARERDRMESEIQQLEQRLRQMEEERTALASSDRANQAARDEQHRAAEQLEALQARRETVSQELFVAESHLNQVLDQRDQMTADVQALQRTLAELQTERSQGEASLDRVARERDRMESEIHQLERTLLQLEEQRTSPDPAVQASSTVLASYHGQEPSPAQDEIEVTEVRFEQIQSVDRIIIEFSGEGATVRSLPWHEGRAGLLIEGARLAEALHRTLDTRAFAGPVQFVSSFTDDGGQIHVLAELNSAASEILSQEGRVTSWEFSRVALTDDTAGDYWVSEFDGHNSQAEPTEAPPIRRPTGTAYTIGERRTSLRVPRLSRRLRVTIDLVNADIQNVLRLFSDEGDVNIIASGAVSGTITLRLRGVPLDQAFALILQSQGLGWEQHGNILRVAPVSEFEEERRRELQRIAEAFDVEPLQVRLRPVSYADGDEMLGLIRDVLSERGSASFDDRTHTLILTDVAENLDAAEQLVDALDRQTPQVLIEARIVQTGETFSRGFGIQWGGDMLFSPANGNATGLLFPSTIGIAGGAGQTPADGTATTPNFAVNVPGPAAGAIGFQFGSLGQAVNLNLRLSAAESSGHAKVISAPRILTLDGQAATISTGLSIPVQTVGAAGTNVTFIQANLSLNVTPTVTPDGFVHLALNITKNEPDFGRTGANGDPSIITRTAMTNLLVRDGETSVIGGIFEHLSGTDQTGIPILSDIPILGVLFHDYSYQDERNETLVFITPRIVNRDVSLANYAPGEVLMTPPD